MYVENLSLVRGGYSLEVVPMVLDHGVSSGVSITSFEVDGVVYKSLELWLLYEVCFAAFV